MAGNNSSFYPDTLTNNSLYQGNMGARQSCNVSKDSPVELIYSKITNYVLLIGLPLIIVPGVIGNILTVLVLLRRFGRWSFTAVFLFVLAISDTVQLLNLLSGWIWDELAKQDVRQLSDLGCKLLTFFRYGPIHYSSWILVAVTVERFICVFWPHHVKQRCTRNIASVVASLPK